MSLEADKAGGRLSGRKRPPTLLHPRSSTPGRYPDGGVAVPPCYEFFDALRVFHRPACAPRLQSWVLHHYSRGFGYRWRPRCPGRLRADDGGRVWTGLRIEERKVRVLRRPGGFGVFGRTPRRCSSAHAVWRPAVASQGRRKGPAEHLVDAEALV